MENEKIDVLNREDFINKLKLLVEMLANKKQGCCLGIDGAWGSGKSFVLEMFEEQLKDIHLEETNDNKYFVFHYDCWKYDYYEEPAIAIVAAMLDTIDNELSMFSEGTKNATKLAMETTKKTLTKIASELCKNKIGIDLVEIASDVLEKHDKEKENNFDSLYGFKRALEETRIGIQKIAEDKTVVIVVDELDRCLPTYSIKVLERLHHIFNDIENVIVILSMDKTQLEHSIKEIYGDIEVDTYLRKFIAFKVSLNYGESGKYFEKYESYVSMFNFKEADKEEIECFLTHIMSGLDIRTQERIFRKAELIHSIISGNEKYDISIMTFEVLYLAAILVNGTKDVKMLVDGEEHEVDNGFEYFYLKINKYIDKTCRDSRGIYYIKDNCAEKAWFWLANLYDSYDNGYCLKFYYDRPIEAELVIINRFAEFIHVIDTD